MDRLWACYYLFLLFVFVIGIGYYLLPNFNESAKVREHFIGVNLTKVNNTCRLTWLGGWDFDSFYSNVTVNGVNKGHPAPQQVISNETCRDIVVEMYDRAIQTDVELYRYNHTEKA